MTRTLCLLLLSWCLGLPSAHADPEVSEGVLIDLKDPNTGEWKTGYLFDLELAPPVEPVRVVQPRYPRSQRGTGQDAVVCWVRFTPKPMGRPGKITLKGDCPDAFHRSTRRAARRFRFTRYQDTGVPPIYLQRMEFSEGGSDD